MNNRDFIEITKFLLREDCDLCNRVIELQNNFNRFKSLDIFESYQLLEARICIDYFDGFEQRLLRLCDYLVKYGGDT